mgnify:CR=1 FL=1
MGARVAGGGQSLYPLPTPPMMEGLGGGLCEASTRSALQAQERGALGRASPMPQRLLVNTGPLPSASAEIGPCTAAAAHLRHPRGEFREERGLLPFETIVENRVSES